MFTTDGEYYAEESLWVPGEIISHKIQFEGLTKCQ